MLVRCVRVVVIGRTIGGKNDNFTTSLFFHVSYARRCISCHIAPVMSSHTDSIQLPDLTSKQCRLFDRLSTDSTLFGFATFLTVQQTIELAFMLASALQSTVVAQIQCSCILVQAFGDIASFSLVRQMAPVQES